MAGNVLALPSRSHSHQDSSTRQRLVDRIKLVVQFLCRHVSLSLYSFLIHLTDL